jgi:ubiquinone/menaquinone biosynthesis C-methylase UbiE
MEHTKIVQEQFERQGEIYAAMAQVQDTKGHQAIVRACGTNASHRVLDVACGPGFLTRQFASVAGEVVGIDVTNKFLTMATAAAKQDGLSNLTFQQGDVNELPFEAASFDIVCCRAAFHHFPQPQRVLSEMTRVLKPGGKIAIADLIVSEDQAKADYHNKMEVLIDPSHARALPLSAFQTLLST